MELTLDTLLSVDLVSLNTSHVGSTSSLYLLFLLCIQALSGHRELLQTVLTGMKLS